MILLVEDDEDVRDMLELTLEASGYTVEVVDNGRAALAAMARQRPCLVILDLVMPVMNGWDVVKEMAARQLADVPVCVISALTGTAPSEAIATLCKPFDPRALRAIAAQYCPHTTSVTSGPAVASTERG